MTRNKTRISAYLEIFAENGGFHQSRVRVFLVAVALVIPMAACNVERPFSRPTERTCNALDLSAADLNAHPSLVMAAEMEFIPEVDGWEACRPDAHPEHAEALKAAWLKQADWVGARVTPAVVRALSRWARAQMRNYNRVPALDNLKFLPVAQLQREQMITYEAVADTLPSHNQLVSRWLKIFVLYSSADQKVLRITVSIRGEATE